jgi:polyisoprenyl-phosphate glycosyltransferase
MSDSTAPQASGIALSVVVPVYKNAESLAQVVERLLWLKQALGVDVEAVFVVDGSPDDSVAILRELLPTSGLASQLLLHSRNFGSFAAIRSGFAVARGEVVAAMAADLQEPVELIVSFYETLSSGDWDVAVGTRVKRDDPAMTKAMSKTYWWAYRRLVQKEMPAGGVDIFACTRPVAQQLARFEESNSSLVGLLFWLGYRRVDVPYSRLPREHGTSAWSWRKKYRYLSDSIFSFTSVPISIILFVGVVGVIASFVAAAVVLGAWAFQAITVPGYTALMLVLLLSTGSILFALGIVGTYVWRTFENTKDRPLAVVMKQETYGDGH